MSIRWKLVLWAIIKRSAVVLPLVLVATTAAYYGLHAYRVWANDGEWCIQVKLDGSAAKRLYGKDCAIHQR